jgi:O-antigen ligase
MQLITSKINLFLLTSFPIFTLIIKGWTSSILFFCLLISLIYFFKNKELTRIAFREQFFQKHPALLFILAAFTLPVVSIVLTTLVNMQFSWSSLDGPSRYLFAIIFLFFLLRCRPDIGKMLTFSITLMPIMTVLLINLVEKKGWAAALPRTTSHFIDPITFGSLCLSFGLMALVLLSEKQTSKFRFVWYGISMLCGLYLSISSESRTGWLAVPIVFLLLLKVRLKISYLKTLIIGTSLIGITSFTLFHSSEIVKNRFNQAAEDISSYQWHSGENLTSIGERISFIRMGWHLMMQKPLTGWANKDFTPQLDSPEFSKFAAPATRLGVKAGGFHNEFINNGVKYGILGLLFTILLFLGPVVFFFKLLKMDPDNRYALLGLVYIAAQAVSALSYQVLDFKFTASLYALMIVTLAYSALKNGNSQLAFNHK